ncbi:hypothetical protein [Reyranella sp.]|uniref:hypothetical protein n=1 Tax=Reyranella sp. TaxID=1929291 RepID=UPI003BA98031
MGFLLKIVLFGVAVYAAWKTFSRWKGLWDRFVGGPTAAPPPVPPSAPQAPPAPAPMASRRATVEDAVQCAGCGAYAAASVPFCSQCGRPLPQGRSGG